MIHSPRRVDAPAMLTRYRQRWSDRFARICTGERSGDWATPAAKNLLRESLHPITRGKCIYCESLLGVTSELNVEHYHAKTLDPGRAFEWNNLLPSCRSCNVSKGESDHGGSLLKPDDEDPEPFFWLHPDTGKLEPHPALLNHHWQRAERTIDLCDLNRAPLCSLRIETMKAISGWTERLTADEWDGFSHPARQYKFVIRHVLLRKGLSLLADEDRRRYTAS